MLLDAHAVGDLKNKRYMLVVDDIQTYTPYMLLETLPIWIPMENWGSE